MFHATMEGETPVIILDSGSGTCKAGMSNEEFPKAVFPEVVGIPRSDCTMSRKTYCGDEINDVRNSVLVSYPIQNGIIEDFDQMQLIWEYAIHERLNVDPQDHAVLLTEPPHNPKPAREEMVEIMFDTFGVESLNISIQGVLSLLGHGKYTGLVLDSGEGVTHTFPVYDGYGLVHCVNRLDLGGRDLNVLLAKLCAQVGTCLASTQEQHYVRQMKEQHCYVCMDPTVESEVVEDVVHKLPDGREVVLNEERWRCPEALFTPTLAGLNETMGVAQLVYDSICKSDIDNRTSLLNNVVLSGGSTMFPGFVERLTQELRLCAPVSSHTNIRVVKSKDKDRTLAVWRGAQVFSNLDQQSTQWMSIDEYLEVGPALIHEKIGVKYS